MSNSKSTGVSYVQVIQVRIKSTLGYKILTMQCKYHINSFEMTDPRHDYSPSFGQMADKPLFGVSKWQDRVINTTSAVFTSLVVGVTVISAFVFPQWPPQALNIFFAICIMLMCVSHITLIHWYNEGGVDPKFRVLIYFNTVLIILFCICANCYYHS